MKIYAVGGAVRDALLGLPVKDRDFVVVGATPEDMQRLGFRPVGRDFPVFLHPQTHEEYALARTERKTGPGYKGFAVYAAPDVTLEQDLSRRDLTINAMARDEDGTLIDPFGGAADLRAGILRHVGAAFEEDPVRVLRVARFAARFGFSVAPDTLTLMERMAAGGEVDHLVPERVWQELSRGLMEAAPSRMVEVLAGCGALARLIPDCPAAGAEVSRRALDHAAARAASLEERFSAWLGGAVSEVSAARTADRLRASSDCRELLTLAARLLARLIDAATAGAEQLAGLLREGDAFRRPARFAQLVEVAADIEIARGSTSVDAWRRRLSAARHAAAAVDAGAIAALSAQRGTPVAEALAEARVAAVREALGRGES